MSQSIGYGRIKEGTIIWQDRRMTRWPLVASLKEVPIDTRFEFRKCYAFGAFRLEAIAPGFGELTTNGSYGNGSIIVLRSALAECEED